MEAALLGLSVGTMLGLACGAAVEELEGLLDGMVVGFFEMDVLPADGEVEGEAAGQLFFALQLILLVTATFVIQMEAKNLQY